MTSLSNGNSYAYDANGNMTHRLVNGQDFYFAYDAENRLAQVSGAVTESFKYDGDGKRVVATQGGISTVYIGNYLEWHSSTADMVKYYYAGATRVAMRVGTGAVTYLLGDHLGSTSVAVDVNAAQPIWQLYKAWGETRAGSVPTKYQYTGQFNNTEIGLYYYGARWYDPSLGRFIQADTIVPLASQGGQEWDRYAYSYGNPVKYIDPTGHEPKEGNSDKSNDDEGWNFFTWTREQRLNKGEPLVFRIGEVVFVIMPPGSKPTINRPEFAQRLGMGLALAGEGFDVGELIQLPFSGGAGAPDLTAFGDVVITQLSTWSNGQSPIGDQYDSSLPPLFGTNQDVLVQFGDFGIALAAKAGGAVVGGPPGYAVGVLVDAETTLANLVYDHNRNFGSWQSHIVVGTPACLDCPDLWGLTYIVIWP